MRLLMLALLFGGCGHFLADLDQKAAEREQAEQRQAAQPVAATPISDSERLAQMQREQREEARRAQAHRSFETTQAIISASQAPFRGN